MTSYGEGGEEFSENIYWLKMGMGQLRAAKLGEHTVEGYLPSCSWYILGMRQPQIS